MKIQYNKVVDTTRKYFKLSIVQEISVFNLVEGLPRILLMGNFPVSSDVLMWLYTVFQCFFPVCMHGWYPQTDGTVRIHDHGRDRAQVAMRNDAAGHQPVLIQILYVQSWTCTLYQCKFYIAIRYILTFF